MINIDDFSKIELKVGTVLEAEVVEESEKLIKLKVDLGEDPPAGGPRQILAGIKQWYKPEDLIGKQVVVVANLEPRMMMGLESQGMMLAASGDDPSTGSTNSPQAGSGQGKPIFLTVPEKVTPGAKVS